MEIPKSKYLDFFLSHKESILNGSVLSGDTLIVERIKFPEKRVGGIIIAESKHIQSTGFTSEAPAFFRVLLVGAGYYDDETKADVPLSIAAGDIIHTSGVSVKLWSSFPMLETVDSDVLGITRYGDALWHWKGEEKFNHFLRDFNSGIKGQISATK